VCPGGVGFGVAGLRVALLRGSGLGGGLIGLCRRRGGRRRGRSIRGGGGEALEKEEGKHQVGWRDMGLFKGVLWIVKVVDFLAATLEDSQVWTTSSPL